MAEFHRKTRGIGFLHRCMLNCNSHDLTLHATVSDSGRYHQAVAGVVGATNGPTNAAHL